ncbi:hypothetical protein VTN77DRAFT_8114 [Rasamsonia byssochlamydoides]|uniref:uncharacterized protein n=1 Tax=Rasamsonia byssochlamydoides TaxID=89139 RepID=UPI003744285C
MRQRVSEDVFLLWVDWKPPSSSRRTALPRRPPFGALSARLDGLVLILPGSKRKRSHRLAKGGGCRHCYTNCQKFICLLTAEAVGKSCFPPRVHFF